MKKTIIALCFALSFGWTSALGQQDSPLPDLWPAEIATPKGIRSGGNNEVRVIVENRGEGSRLDGTVTVELIVIELETKERTSYTTVINAMNHGRKSEAVFTDVTAKGPELVRFLAIVDPDEEIRESNELNNRKLYQVRLEDAPRAVEESVPATDESDDAIDDELDESDDAIVDEVDESDDAIDEESDESDDALDEELDEPADGDLEDPIEDDSEDLE